MTAEISQMICPGCGAPVSISSRECEFCHGPIVISTFRSVYTMPIANVNNYISAYKKRLATTSKSPELNNSIAMCYLKLGLYAKALQSFEMAISENIENSESYFYAAICLLNGKKAFLANRGTIDKIEEYINAAIMIEPRGIFYYFLAYIKYDYYFRKHFKVSPMYGDLLKEANTAGYRKEDTELLFSILSVDKPPEF
mgnify:CR=1 FL=1|jgi:putative TPR-repeat-containing protein